MDLTRAPSEKPFDGFEHFFAKLEPTRIAELATAATDIAVLLDRAGHVVDVAHCESNFPAEVKHRWIGRPFVETVTTESRAKIERMLGAGGVMARSQDAGKPDRAPEPVFREINHAMPNAADLPISYRVLTLCEREGSRIALGHDLRETAELQRSLVRTQLSLEREAARHRAEEARYRLLFETSAEPTLVLDAAERRLVAANAAFHDHSGGRAAPVGSALGDLFPQVSKNAMDRLLDRARAQGPDRDTLFEGADSEGAPVLSARFSRRNGVRQFVVRLVGAAREGRGTDPRQAFASAADALPDGIVLCDEDGRIRAANEAFVDLVEHDVEADLLNRNLSEWVGPRPGEFAAILASLAESGRIESFATHLMRATGESLYVELSAARVEGGGAPMSAFAVRRRQRTDRRTALATTDAGSGREPIRSASDMTGLVGRVSLKEIVRETADIIERLCIEAALEITRNNRAAAAELLGLSRQSLYSKLRRYGIGENDPTEAND